MFSILFGSHNLCYSDSLDFSCQQEDKHTRPPGDWKSYLCGSKFASLFPTTPSSKLLLVWAKRRQEYPFSPHLRRFPITFTSSAPLRENIHLRSCTSRRTVEYESALTRSLPAARSHLKVVLLQTLWFSLSTFDSTTATPSEASLLLQVQPWFYPFFLPISLVVIFHINLNHEHHKHYCDL